MADTKRKEDSSPREFQKWLKQIDKDIINISKLIVKPLPLRWRIPALLLGVSLFALGGIGATYFLGNSFIFVEGGKWHIALTPFSFLGSFLGFVGIIVGFMIIHKALSGVWV